MLFRNDTEIKVQIEAHLLRSNCTFFSLNSPTIRLKKHLFDRKILNLNLNFYSSIVP